MATRAYHHGALRATLITRATDHIAREGVETLSIRALAKEAGVAHRAAYQHFPDKDGLIAAVFVEAYARLDARIEKTVAASVEDRLMQVARALAAFADEEPNMFLAMTGPRINRSGAHEALEKAIAKSWRHVAGPIGDGVDSGLFGTPDKRAAAALFWGGFTGVVTQAALGRLKVKPSERARFFEDAAARLMAGLRAAGAP
ncbi:MAG: TetR/AcrR family transcriptional regulator [Parvularculaceae bacterium]|nr:TetR/AcrR family transcriptional regulator [Parvularculaceae bacterium]